MCRARAVSIAAIAPSRATCPRREGRSRVVTGGEIQGVGRVHSVPTHTPCASFRARARDGERRSDLVWASNVFHYVTARSTRFAKIFAVGAASARSRWQHATRPGTAPRARRARDDRDVDVEDEGADAFGASRASRTTRRRRRTRR